MSRSRIFSKLIIPIALLTIYSITLIKTATAPVEPSSSEEQEVQTAANQQSLAAVEEKNTVIPRPPQAPSALIGVTNSAENFRFVVLTDPKMVPASQATWLEPDEVVVGIVNAGEAQAFPIKQMALHHIVNTRVAGSYYIISYCAFCNGQAMAFIATIDDIRYTFNIYGISQNQMAMIDRQTESVWQQMDGKILSGPSANQGLSLQPTVLTRGTWDDWKRLYPDTLVLPQYPDHKNQYSLLNNDGQFQEAQFTLILNRDSRLPAETTIVGTNIGNIYTAYVVNEEHLANGIISDNLGGTPIVIFFDDISGNGKVFLATINDQVLSFSKTNGKIIDSTGSTWDTSGRALNGIYRGSQLTAVASLQTEWSYWSMYHPETNIYGR